MLLLPEEAISFPQSINSKVSEYINWGENNTSKVDEASVSIMSPFSLSEWKPAHSMVVYS